MRILDEDTNSAIKRVSLFLTREEAESLRKQLDTLIAKPKNHHVHVEDESFEREITIAMYSKGDVSQFDERSRRLIEKDA